MGRGTEGVPGQKVRTGGVRGCDGDAIQRLESISKLGGWRDLKGGRAKNHARRQ